MSEQEVWAFEQQFAQEELEIVAVTGASDFGGGKGRGEAYWTASIALTAWRAVNETEVHRGDSLLTAKANDAYLAELRERAPRDSIIRVRVRPNERRFLIVSLPEAAEDEALARVLREQLAVVTYEDPELGVFTLDRSVSWYEQQALWLGEPVALYFDEDEPAVMRDALRTASALLAQQAAWDERIRGYAADELLTLKNEYWLEEDEPEVTRAEFMSRLSIDGLQVGPEGEFEFWFSDGDLFWGHSVRVSGDLNEGPTDAAMEG